MNTKEKLEIILNDKYLHLKDTSFVTFKNNLKLFHLLVKDNNIKFSPCFKGKTFDEIIFMMNSDFHEHSDNFRENAMLEEIDHYCKVCIDFCFESNVINRAKMKQTELEALGYIDETV